jgi:hypothetical protein
LAFLLYKILTRIFVLFACRLSPAEVTQEGDDETPGSTTMPLRFPFPFREIRLWPEGDALTIDPPEFMKVAELLAALSLGAAEGQGFAATQLKRLFLDLLKVQGWEYPFQIHERYRTLARCVLCCSAFLKY